MLRLPDRSRPPQGDQRRARPRHWRPAAKIAHLDIAATVGIARFPIGATSAGGIRFPRPLVSLSNPAETLDFPNIDGLVGFGLIEQMNPSTDLRARRIWALRNCRRPRPERYGMSGPWLLQRGGAVVIDAVGTGSPAAAAGLRPNHRLDRGSLDEWIVLLGGPPGTRIEIPFRRDGAAQSVTLTLRSISKRPGSG